MNVLAVVALVAPVVASFFLRGIFLVAVCAACIGILIYLAAKESFVYGLFYAVMYPVLKGGMYFNSIGDYIENPWNVSPVNLLSFFYTAAAVISILRFIHHMQVKINKQEEQIKQLKQELMFKQSN